MTSSTISDEVSTLSAANRFDKTSVFCRRSKRRPHNLPGPAEGYRHQYQNFRDFQSDVAMTQIGWRRAAPWRPLHATKAHGCTVSRSVMIASIGISCGCA